MLDLGDPLLTSWDTYLQQLADMQLPDLQQLPLASYPQQAQIPAAELNAPINLKEVLEGLQKLHNGRAQGPQGYPAELLRYASESPSPPEPPPVHVLAPVLVKDRCSGWTCSTVSK